MKNILVLGGSGNLGSAVKNNTYFKSKSFFPSKKKINILHKNQIKNFLKEKKIQIVINCAAIARMKECEKNKKKAFNINVIGAFNLYKAINEVDSNIMLLHISSDAVYYSTKGNYNEKSKIEPYNFYGFTKVLSENIAKKLKKYIIVRTRFFNKKSIMFKDSATDSYSSSLEINQLVKYLKILIKKNFNGTINIGGEKISDYNLYIKYKKNLKKCTYIDIQSKLNFKISKDASMNCALMKKVFNAKN